MPHTTVAPLGLGSGSGVGSQHETSYPSMAAGAKAFMESRDRGVDARDDKGRTALHFACGMASAECARLLLEAGADANMCDKDGYTPMHMAAGYGRSNCVKLLLEHGASVFTRERAGRTPKELALELRADVNQGYEALKIPRGDIDLTIQLLTDAESKDNISVQEKVQKMPGKRSICAANEKVVAGAAPPPQSSNTSAGWKNNLSPAALANALSAACRGGHVDVAELLISNGAQVDAHDPDGATPLLAAADSGSAKCVQLLLKHGAKADAKDRVGVTALIAAAYNGHADCLRVLMDHGAAVDAKSHGGVTPLIAAAEGRNAYCTQVLLHAGARVDAKTSEGKTALMHSVSRNCIEATLSLLNGGADVNAADGDGCTALHHGSRNNSVDCLRLLLEREADVTRKCRRGRTPFQEAPKGSLAAKLLEDRWKQLESEIELRQVELLNLFARDKTEHKSSKSKKPGTRHARDKKKGKRKKETVEKTELGRQELAIVTSKLEECLAVDILSSSGSEVEGNTLEVEIDQATSALQVGPEEYVAFENLHNGEANEGDKLPWESARLEKEISKGFMSDTNNGVWSSSPGGSGKFLAAEDDIESEDMWIKVDGKGGHNHQPRITPTAVTSKTHTSQSRSQVAVTSALLSSRSIKPGDLSNVDYVPLDRKTSIALRNRSTAGIVKNCKEDNARDGDISPWVQALVRKGHSLGSPRSARPHVKVDIRASLPEPKAEVTEEAVHNESLSSSGDVVNMTSQLNADISPPPELKADDAQETLGIEFSESIGNGTNMRPNVTADTRTSLPDAMAENVQEAVNIDIPYSVLDATNMGPSVKSDLQSSPPEIKAEDMLEVVNIQITSETTSSTEEKLSDRVERIEQELDRARVDMQKVRELELLVSARGLGNTETNLRQIADMTQALEVQVTARVHAENAKTQMEVRIWDLESIVTSQRKALEAARAEVAELKLQMLKREEQHKQEYETQQRESVAAAVAAAAASWRAWEVQHPRSSLQGWLPEGAGTSPGEYDPSLRQSSLKVQQAPLSPDSISLHKKEGEKGDREIFEWKCAATAAAMAAVSLRGIKNTGCLSLDTHSSHIVTQDSTSINPAPESVTKPGPATCDWVQDAGRVKGEAHESLAGQLPNKVGRGSGMMRSASEGSLHLIEGLTEHQQLLPFIPIAGPKIDPVNGWFSLVPSPMD